MAEYLLKHFQVGALGTNCYMVACPHTKQAMVIDPGASAKRIFEEAQKEGWKIVYIVDTHGHWDHIGANKELQALTGAPILIHADDADYLRDSQLNIAGFFRKDGDGGEAAQLLHDGDAIQVGDLCFQVIHTPGHTPGGISLLLGKQLFCGDTLFQHSIGRTDFAGGDLDAIIDSIQNKLYPLGDDVTVYPGHGPLTTIGEEKKYNPFTRG